MKFIEFEIRNYRAINNLTIDLSKTSLVPLVGINECGKTTILQAIYCFDYTCDKEYDGKHLKDIKNLYNTSDKDDPFVIAKIQLKLSDLNDLYAEFLKEYKIKNITVLGQPEEEMSSYPDILKFQNSPFTGVLHLARNLQTQKYTIRELETSFSEEFHNGLGRKIVANLPYILYNDDFMDRPPAEIHIPTALPESFSGWLSIYQELFEQTDPNYSIHNLVKETDPRRRQAILSDVETLLNRTLSKAWKSFLLSNQNGIEVVLNLKSYDGSEKTKYSHTLEIHIVEKINYKDRFFDIMDRSKGFVWFFNFVMKIQFNSKVISNRKDNIYLLDEPGSYLHYSAQEKLCHKLVEISQKHGIVIYCTHSHTLLNPDLIPLNNIYVIEKNKNKQINAKRLPLIKTKIENTSAYQPIHEALQLSAFDLSTSNYPVIAVEGIYDKYSIELFTKLPKKLTLLPGMSADSIVKNIQFLNAYNKHYIAIWDNDDEGRRKYDLASTIYGEFETKKFDKLPLLGRKSRRMEEMFENNDLEVIRLSLDLQNEVSYERIISTLYFTKGDKRKKIVDSVSDGTKKNFEILNEIIEKRLKLSESLLSD